MSIVLCLHFSYARFKNHFQRSVLKGGSPDSAFEASIGHYYACMHSKQRDIKAFSLVGEHTA